MYTMNSMKKKQIVKLVAVIVAMILLVVGVFAAAYILYVPESSGECSTRVGDGFMTPKGGEYTICL